jgi:ribonuclease HI
MGIGVVLRRHGACPAILSEACGDGTRNKAAYLALVRALEVCTNLRRITNVVIHTSNELLVRQMEGKYEVRDENLEALHGEADRLRREFVTVRFVRVRPEQNKDAKALARAARPKDEARDPVAACA